MLVRAAWVLARKLTRGLELWHRAGLRGVVAHAAERVRPRPPANPAEWLAQYRPKADQLARFRARRWPADAPRFSVLMPVYDARPAWLRQAVESVVAQTYPHWQLVCVNDGSPAPHVRPLLDELAAADPRVTVVHLPANRGVSAASNAALAAATGDHVAFMDHDDALEPHALHRLAEAVLADQPDVVYSDEALTGESLDDVLAVRLRPAFSYDYYLSHPYFVHLVAARTALVRAAGGFDESLTVSHDVDLVLRLIERAATVSHVPDVLYRWRTHAGSLGHRQKQGTTDATVGALTRHLARIGADATVHTDPHLFNVADVRFRPPAAARVAVLIPSKNQAELLRACVESLERTLDPALADVVVIDHNSDAPDARAYLSDVRAKHRVVPATGPFNFSAIVNQGVAAVRGPYTHYLFLNNDTVAPEPGWLEHMLGLAGRPDVGGVGATLLYPDGTVQHAGVVVGLLAGADHAFRSWPFARNWYTREYGDNCGLISTRDYSAVTAACLLMKADVFHQIGGFDESLAVGFNDTDLCLRTVAAGYKVVNDAHAVLFHHESKSRGTADRHPTDTARFRERYAALLAAGDPYFHPLLDPDPIMNRLSPRAVCPDTLAPRTTRVVLPCVPSAVRKAG